MQARHVTIMRYPPQQGWYRVEVRSPKWKAVSTAIRKMDDREYPIVLLSWKDVDTCFDDEDAFNIVGGASGFALFEMNPGWKFENPDGGCGDVRLWQSDQGYYCKRRNIIVDIDEVLKLTRVYFETGSYDAVQRACSTSRNG
jgi:hypothetical protein